MKILLANSFFVPAVGGIENYLLNLGRELVAKGHSVTVLTSRHDPALAPREDLEGLEVLRYDFSFWPGFASLADPLRRDGAVRRAFREVTGQREFDVIWAGDFYSMCGAVSTGIPTVFIHAVAFQPYVEAAYRDDPEHGLRRRLYSYLMRTQAALYWSKRERELLERTPIRVAVSEAKSREMADHYRLSQSSYDVVYPGINSEQFRPVGAADKAALRERLGLPLDAFIFLYVGRFGTEKNPRGLLQAFSRMAPERPVCLVMVGPKDAGFEELVSRTPSPGPVVLPGAQMEPVEWYQAADAYVLPSLAEGFGIVLLEAMASGLPILGFRNPEGSSILATEEVVRDGETGLLVDYNDVDALTGAMGVLSDSPEKAQMMGMAGRERARTSFSWKRAAERLLRLSRQAMNHDLALPTERSAKVARPAGSQIHVA